MDFSFSVPENVVIYVKQLFTINLNESLFHLHKKNTTQDWRHRYDWKVELWREAWINQMDTSYVGYRQQITYTSDVVYFQIRLPDTS